MKIVDWYIDTVEDLSYNFTPECYEDFHGYSKRFPSVFSFAFRFLIKYAYLAVPVLWIAALVIGIVEKAPFYQTLLLSPIVTVLEALAIVLIFAVLMLVESFCKLLAGLILEGEVPDGAENPIDAFLMFIFR